MPDYYSEHYGPAASPPATAESDPRVKTAPGKHHAKAYQNVTHMNFANAVLAATDKVFLFSMKSGDRLTDLLLSKPTAGWTGVATADVGIYDKAGNVIDVDLFASGVDLAGAQARADILVGAALADTDRGKALWEMAALGAGTYTTDPLEDWDVVMTVATGPTTASAALTVEASYAPAGVS